MVSKISEAQAIAIRQPRQDRARHKVELILEAAMRLIDKGGLAQLTTNAVAETAGVSIGTLYQYFANKEAILDALADREMAAASERVIAAMADPHALSARERIATIVKAVTSGYGERRRVHRLVVERSLAQGSRRLGPLLAQLNTLLTSEGRPASATAGPMSPADAFVLTHAFTGVMRAMIMRPEDQTPSEAEIEDALARLVLGFA